MRVSLKLRQLSPPPMLGHLVDSNSPRVHIISPSTTPGLPIPRGSGLDERTEAAKSPNPGMARLPLTLAKRVNAMTRNTEPQLTRQRVAKLYRELSKGAAHAPALDGPEVDAHVQGYFLQDYTAIASALREIQKRKPGFAPDSVLDVGFGPATGLLAAREVFGYGENAARMDNGRENNGRHDTLSEDSPSENAAVEETAVIIGHPRMMSRAKELTASERTPPKFRYDIPSRTSPKRFDLIIATHQLYQTGKFNEELADSHAQQLARLCSDNGVVLFVERGDPLGFEATAIAREHLLRPKYNFGVVGPCSHTQQCPLQLGLKNRETSGNAGKQNWCRFGQNVERPRFTKELKKGQYLAQKWVPGLARGHGGNDLKGSGRPGMTNSEMANFSYVALENNPVPLDRLPRIMKPPYKRQRHVLMEVCAPSGNIEHWTVPKSQGRQAYHDVRKANAGDLWALDAKVKQERGGLRRPEEYILAAQQRARDLPAREVSIDWWLPKSNPFYKHSSHQARKRVEDMAEPENDSFLGVMESLERDHKTEKKELQSRYR